MSKKLKYLVLHCTATPEGRTVSKHDIERWHIVERGWSRVGYSDMIHLNGTVENLIPYNFDDVVDSWEISNGARGYNSISRHVVYVGGINKNFFQSKDTRTDAQKKSLLEYCRDTVSCHPEIKIIGHNQISKKSCPSFDVEQWLIQNGFNDQNIGL